RHQARKGWTRLLLLFDARATWHWLALTNHLELEEKADASIVARRWSVPGIRQRLAMHDKLHSDEVCKKIFQATGGWPYLLDELFARCRAHDDARPFAEGIERELTVMDSPIRQQFVRSLGLNVNQVSARVLTF